MPGTNIQKYFYAKYGDQDYYFSLCLYNNLNNLVFLQRNSMIYLELDDNIFNPFHTGIIVIANDLNILEKSLSPYVFLGNGRDILDIEIIPKRTDNIEADVNNDKVREYLGLKFQFVITESEDIVYNGVNCKKLTLVEYAQYILAENICNIFNIQKYGGSNGNPIETIGANSVSTGEAIKAILNSVFSKDGNPAKDLFYLDSNGKEIFEFDKDSKLFLSPHGCVSYMEVLNYVLTFTSYQKSPCILEFDRYQKKFMLISLKSVFKDNEKYCIETFKIASPSLDTAYNVVAKETPTLNWNVFPISFEESRVIEYNISSPTTKYNVELSGNSSILSYARSYKTMIFNINTLNSDSFIKDYTDLFVTPFKKMFGNSLPYGLAPNFYENPNKKNNFNDFQGYLAPELNESKFLNQKLKSLLYMNNVYQFVLNGKTHRKSLSFVDLVKIHENNSDNRNPNQWDLNNIGRHFITKVKHIFTYDRYVNKIETIKTYRLVNKNSSSGSSLDQFLAGVDSIQKLSQKV